MTLLIMKKSETKKIAVQSLDLQLFFPDLICGRAGGSASVLGGNKVSVLCSQQWLSAHRS